MPIWLINIGKAIFSKEKIMGFVAGIIIAVLMAVFGLSAKEIKDAVANAPVIQLPTVVSTSTTVPVGK